ncbi:hypothetical protein GWK47_032902 [Chionoecetes opilio]|uniref:Uncharacterized protein n=1 Tax=Chionoecetes opilio TaxID=41210 RepID=A0A8J4YHL0_CHIOP|nr:hypothetical protein GWK47_032902 [Chionoecetes opilio]
MFEICGRLIVPLYSKKSSRSTFRKQIAEGNQRAWELLKLCYLPSNVQELCRPLAPHMTTRILPFNKKVLATPVVAGKSGIVPVVFGDRFWGTSVNRHFIKFYWKYWCIKGL